MWVAQLITSLFNVPRDQTNTAIVTSPEPTIVLDELVAVRARSLRRAGNTDAAQQLLSSTTSSSARLVTERIATALEAGDLEFARVTLVDPGKDSDLEPRTRAEHLALAAILAHRDSRPQDARELVHKALEVAQRDVLIRTLLDIGPSFLTLVEAFASTTSSFARLLLAKSRAITEPSPGAALRASLTKRERELIVHLPTRMSNAEIATLESVSVNTIKTHMAHLYQKLGVKNRDAAITRARALGLLE
jgi:LuxR family maltose regulon positive regulatory protein